MNFGFFIELVMVPLGLMFGMTVAQEIGVRLRRRHETLEEQQHDNDGISVVDAAVFGLMGLLLAFAFSGAAERFDHRRDLIVQEANDIGTAWMRIDLLPAADQPLVRQKFREYLDARLESYADVSEAHFRAGLEKSTTLQNEIWALCVASSERAKTTVTGMLLLASLNDMFDTVTERNGAILMHAPLAVYGLLIVVLLLCSTLAGYRLGSRAHWSGLHRMSFVVILALTYYLIVDLEYPRHGLINVDSFDTMLVQVRQSMQ